MFLQTWKEKRGREVRVKKIFIWGEKQHDNGSEWSKKSVELRDSEGSVEITYKRMSPYDTSKLRERRKDGGD